MGQKVEGKLVYFGPWNDPAGALANLEGVLRGQITKVSSGIKPAKPQGFPLFAHASGQWAKKVKGKVYYFGPWSRPDAALKRWKAEREARRP